MILVARRRAQSPYRRCKGLVRTSLLASPLERASGDVVHALRFLAQAAAFARRHRRRRTQQMPASLRATATRAMCRLDRFRMR